MKVKILHLYYDIMNLYGENGNVRMMERRLKDQGLDVEVDKKTLTDTFIDFTQYDFIYCGCGTESNRNACLKHLSQFAVNLKTAFAWGRVMLFTGNAYEMLGKTLTDPEGNTMQGIGMFSFNVTEERKNRYSGDVVASCKLFDMPFVGFINKCSKVEGVSEPMLTITRHIGTVADAVDGIISDNFFGTQLIGPILVKNPHFAEYLVKKIVKNYKNISYPSSEKGYQITLTELMKDSNNYV